MKRMFEIENDRFTFESIQKQDGNDRFFRVFLVTTLRDQVMREGKALFQLPQRESRREISFRIVPIKDRSEKIDRGFLGFAGADSPEDSLSNKQRRKRLEAMKDAAQRWIHRDLASFLTERIGTALSRMDKWDLCSASLDEDPDGQTLLFTYPSAISQTGGYIRRQVKIEMGARSDNEPVEEREVHPYLFDALPSVIGPSMFRVRVLAAERTFWEKAMLVHEETLRPPGRRRPARLARHYYDLWCLITAGIGERAAEREDIFARTVRHREVYFNWSWMDYSTLKRGGLRLVPLPEMVAEWRRDYQAMSGEMFFGEVPEFDLVIKVIESFQRRFNEK